MAFWSGETIQRRAADGKLVTDFNHDRIDCAAYQLRMGREVFITPDQKMRKRYQRNKLFLKNGESFSIPPGQFAFLLTKEYLEVPVDTIGFISLRTGMKYLGLVNVSGFHVDPGFRGHLIYAVYNAGPVNIVINEGQPLFRGRFGTGAPDNRERMKSGYASLSQSTACVVKTALYP